MNISQQIAKAHYVANETMVESLAQERYTSAELVTGSDTTYLRVVIAAMQAKTGKVRRGRSNPLAQAEVLAAVNERFYPHVLKGVTTPDVDPTEANLTLEERRRRSLARNSRSNFARTAVSTIATYLRGGGDIRGIDVNAVTKSALRAAVAPPEPENKIERQIERNEKALIRAFKRQARDDTEAATEAIAAFIDTLRELVLNPTGKAPEPAAASRRPRDTGTRRTRVGGPPVILHRGH